MHELNRNMDKMNIDNKHSENYDRAKVIRTTNIDTFLLSDDELAL